MMDSFEHEHRSKHHHRDRDRERHKHRHHHHRRRRDSREAVVEATPPPAPPPLPPAPLPTPVQNQQVTLKNFKLIVDPCLVKGATKKIYRFDGIVAGEPSWNVSNVKDPRPKLSRLWTRDVLDLPVPRFKIDKNYVGDPPEVEITITNINDNIDKAFLTDLVSKYGDLEEVSIFYHPHTRKHTGNARIVFTEVSSAHSCVAALHKKSVMGKSLNTFIDPMAKEWMKIIQKITKPDEEKKEESPMKSAVEVEPPKSADVDLKSKEVVVDTKPPDISALNIAPTPVVAVAEPPTPIFSVPPPTFTRPPPMVPPPTAVPPPWPPRPEWSDNSAPWSHPPPPIPSQWPTPPPFMSPPPALPPQPTEPAPTETDKSLDLDTRIELLLKGGINGMAPPFLSLDEEEEKKKTTKPSRSRSSSVSLEEEDEPLPPGVDVSPSYSPTAPVPSLCEHSSDKYLPLSTPPSPFLSEEEYLESLLKWRLRHLSFVQQEEEEERRKKSRIAPDKVSEISSEEDETVFAKNDDQMSLSSLSSVNENIEEVAIPSNPYGSYHAGEGPSVGFQQFTHPPPDTSMWPPYGSAYPGSGAMPYPPYTMYPEHFNHYQTSAQEPVGQEDLLSDKVEAALDRVCELMTATLERDIMKRLTEVLAFNEFEKWWESEERKHREAEEKKPEKENDTGKDDVEEKKSTTDALLNAIIDSNLDSVMSGFTLGFRAALPKMPSFRKKQPMPQPRHNDSRSKFDRNDRNESDDEEMVKLSDSESRDDLDDVSESRKKRLDSVSSSSLSSSSESSDSEESEAESVVSDAEKMAEAREEFLSLIDDEKLEELRSKTPEDRLTPLPFDDFSDVESKSSSRASSPGASQDLKRYAMEALAALGLDEFSSLVKIVKDKQQVTKPTLLPAASSTVKREKTKVAKQPAKPVVKAEPIEREEPVKAEVKEEVKEEGEITVDAIEAVDVMETSPAVDIISAEHSYSRPEGQAKPAEPSKPAVDSWILDHDYTSARAPVSDNAAIKSTKKERKKKSEKLVSHLLDSYLKKEPRASKTYPARDPLKEMMTCYEFLTKGVDQEDINYMKKAFEVLLKDETQSYWLSQMHWAPHPVTDLCRTQAKRSKGHQSGCARTQGFYKLDPAEKRKMKHHYGRNKTEMQAATEAKTWTTAGREARSHQRRLLTAFSALTDSDLLKFNQLKFRKKLLKFGKSEIHDWGLFAKEPIVADEMVIEYVGQNVRPFLADYREIKYQKSGIGSSYLFRIDSENIVDATTCGNLARFINHSCNPNCYAKIITIESEKKIVIYSRRDIKVDEEITYDYKFPLEEEKIACLCGHAQCKGFLN